MRTSPALLLAPLLAGAIISGGSAFAQTADATAGKPIGETVQTGSEFQILRGRWVRPDGGYVIDIRSVSSTGTIEATYKNPRVLPFAKADASRDGDTIKVFLELRAGGYNGSTYSLTYDPAADVLKGVYDQAVARQKFDVQFNRTK